MRNEQVKALITLYSIIILLMSAGISVEAEETLSSLISGSNCELSCWLGIQSMMPEAEVVQILNMNNIQFEKKIIGNSGLLTYDVVGEVSNPYVASGFDSPIIIYVNDGMVAGIDIRLTNTTIDEVIEEFGSPVAIVDKAGAIALTYPEKGIVFSVDSDHAYLVKLRQEITLIRSYIGDPFAEEFSSCSDTTQLCSVSTATVMPTLIPTPMNGCNASPLTSIDLITAINNGNSIPASYTICLDPSVTYTFTAYQEDFYGKTALPSITGDIVIKGNGATIERDTSSSTPQFRLFGVNSNAHFTLENLTLKGGSLDVNAGAALVNVFGNVTLDHVVLEGNEALHTSDASGGAIYNYHGALTITDSLLQTNHAAVSAAAVFNRDGAATITDSCILGNTAPDNIEIGQLGDATTNASGNWWGEDGVSTSAGASVVADDPLSVAPLTCGLEAISPTPTLVPTDAPTATSVPTDVPTVTPIPTEVPTLTTVPTNAPTAAPSPTPVDGCTADHISTEARLKAEITAANGRSTPSVLCLEPDTEFTLVSVSAPNSGSGDTYLPVITKDITILGNNAMITNENVLLGRLARVSGTGAKLTLDNLRIINWMASGTSFGGVVRVDNGGLVFRDITVDNGNAQSGGVIYNNLGTVELIRTTVVNSSATADGGVIYNAGTLTVMDSDLSYNQAGNRGGAIYTTTSITVSGTAFSGDQAWGATGRGGAIFIVGTTAVLTATDVDFDYNGANLRGGAIYTDNADVFLAGGSLTNNGVGDASGDGGAIYVINSSASVTLDGVVITGNSAADQGGAVAVGSGTGSMVNSCLAQNTAATGGSVWSGVAFNANGNWWEGVPNVNSNVTRTTVLQTCPVADLEPLPMDVTALNLINSTTSAVVFTLSPEMATLVDLRPLTPAEHTALRFQADVSPATVGSVVFEVDGSVYSTDNTASYRLSWPIQLGGHTITATPYTGPNGTGMMGTPMTVVIEVTDYVISQPVVSSGKTYVRDTLLDFIKVYIDRSDTFTSIQDDLYFSDFIETAQDDRTLTGTNFMTFTAVCDVSVFVAYDGSISPRPSWLSSANGWELTDMVFTTSQNGTRTTYVKQFPEGPITLGANYGTSTSYMYSVIVEPDWGDCNINR